MHEKPETVAFWRGLLPHWEVVDGRYFITVHLAGAIPVAAQEEIRRMATTLAGAVANGQAALDVQRRIFREMESWLDRAATTKVLAQPPVAAMVTAAIEERTARGDWEVFEYVIMPSHLHMFLRLDRNHKTLKAVM